MEALLIIDVQNDFCPGGALAVDRGDEVVEVANRLMPRFGLVVATQDWHPPGHGSFASAHPGHNVYDVVDLDGLEQTLWPDHCVQGTAGASFHSALDVTQFDYIVRKGEVPRIDSYSGFKDNGQRKDTGLYGLLRAKHVDSVCIMGLATDFCVKYTAMDALSLGLYVTVVENGCKAVNLQPYDHQRVLNELSAAGCHVTTSDQVIGPLY